jgi:hypothetical protein
MHENFTSETEVWFHNPDRSTAKYKVYNQFTIKVQLGRVSDKPELVLSYDGTTKVFAKPVSAIYNFNTNLYNWIVCNGMSSTNGNTDRHEVINQPQNCYPILSNELKPHLEIAFDVPDLKNRYPKYLGISTRFLQQVFKQRCFSAASYPFNG